MSDERDPETDQPLPVVNDRPFVQDLVIADIEARKALGVRKYGTAPQSGNGRNMLQDAYEEALDLAIYLRGALDEQEHASPVPYTPAVTYACCGRPVGDEIRWDHYCRALAQGGGS